MRARLNADPQAQQYCEQLLPIGNGTFPYSSEPDYVCLNSIAIVVSSEDDLITKVYPNIESNYSNIDWLAERAILAPVNETVNNLNKLILGRIPSPPFIYPSRDSTVTDEDAIHYPQEFLNSIEISGLPPHILQVKIGTPVMLLRSLKPPKIMIGTRCVVTKALDNVIEVVITVGKFKGEFHLILRIALQLSDTALPFTFKRIQFPLKTSFAMTINQSQGQTLQTVGLDLRQSVFTHGMLYVAVSRTGAKTSTFALATDGKSRNITYQEVL